MGVRVWVNVEDFGSDSYPVPLILRAGRLWHKNGAHAVEYYGKHIYFSEESAWKAIRGY